MRILLEELKKLFRVRYVLCIAAVCAVVFIMCVYMGGSYLMRLFNSTGTERAGYYHDYGSAALSQEYRTFKWFTEKFGTRITDETIAEIDKLTYPLMEKQIAGSGLFKQLGVKSVAEYDALLDRYTFSRDYRLNPEMKYYYSDGAGDDNKTAQLLTKWAKYAFYSPSIDAEISQNETFINNGVRTFDEFVNYVQNADDNSIDNSIEMESSFHGMLWNLEYTAPVSEEAAALADEYWRFWFCKKLKYAYTAAKSDTMSFANGFFKEYQQGYTHTSDEFFSSKLFSADNGLYFPTTYMERLETRINQLGEDFYQLKSAEITKTFESSAPVLFTICIGASIILAGLYAVKDNRSRMKQQIYSAKIGRKLIKTKLLAVVVSAAIISAIFSVVVVVLSSMSLFAEFYSLPLSSFADLEMYWINVNMWQYIAIYCVYSFVICAGLSLVSFGICSFFSGYIPAISVSLPLIVGTAFLYAKPLGCLFSLPESIFEDILILAAAVLVSLLVGIIHTRKARREPV
ncbi:MAG: hypothetical protein ACI4JZ_05005 [Oscillospiraceae bacterium]